LIQGYLNALINIGILKKKAVFNKRKFIYYHDSPLFDLFFYSDENYGVVEQDLPPLFLKKVIDEKIPFHVERFVESLAAKVYGMVPVRIDDPEIDLALTSFNKLRIVGEVKWKKVSQSEVKEVEKKLGQFDAKRLLVVPDKEGLSSDVLTICEPMDLLRGIV